MNAVPKLSTGILSFKAFLDAPLVFILSLPPFLLTSNFITLYTLYFFYYIPKRSRNNNKGGKRKTQRTKSRSRSRSANRAPSVVPAAVIPVAGGGGTFGFSRPANKKSKNKKP